MTTWVDKIKKFDWKLLVPKFVVQKYQYAAAGFEFTIRPGLGFALGLGVVDLWFGWPWKKWL